MIYLDNGATSLHKPPSVKRAVADAMERCANPGRGGYPAAEVAARTVYSAREAAGRLFACEPEQVVFTSNCTHGLNMAIRSLVKPGASVAITGFEHNAVTRPLKALGTRTVVAGRKLFDPDDTLERFEDALCSGVDAAVFTHMSNVFGYILPVGQMAALCRQHGVPFIVDAAQSAGGLPISLKELGAAFIAMPGHKGLLGPQGTGLLLCNSELRPLLYGGTGSASILQDMPDFLPDRGEAGTLNVPGIAGLGAGIEYLLRTGVDAVFARERAEAKRCVHGLKRLGFQVFSGADQGGTVSFVADKDCELVARQLAKRGIAVRAGLHCAPLAHESAGTLETGAVRVSYGHDAAPWQTARFLQAVSAIAGGKM
ncbi:MAG: aminotransferase class V-fold PLP-dependent enzyme [Oscillospiraceae bacterium]|nr:aminotransferase class V-fold PLP-dependent enzyme [Oscillospiraceae bacterium]